MNIRTLIESDHKKVRRLLNAEGLPTDDLSHHFDNFKLLEENGEIIGVCGIEKYGDIGLIRSLVIEKNKRNKKHGKLLLDIMESNSKKEGINKLYLLTENSAAFFLKHGYIKINREAAPNEIKNTQQFSSLCPQSAILMRKDL